MELPTEICTPINLSVQRTFHLAIIMDGNGRWATQRGLPRLAGHKEGANALERVMQAAPGFGVSDLSVYAFSSDNWRRPPEEVSGLMTLFRRYLESEVDRCRARGVRISMIGRRDRLPRSVADLMASAERTTAECRKLHLRIAVDYSSRDSLIEAARQCGVRSREAMSAALPAPDVDLLIRTGGEQRLSDFLLWESAYAEFVFTDRMWPDFGEDDLRDALRIYGARQRRFGALPAA